MKKHNILSILFKHEIRILLRNRVLISLCSLIIFVLISALWTGSSMLHKQERTIAAVEQSEKEITDSLKTRIRRIESNDMVYPGFIWDDPTFAYNTARNEGPGYAIKKPFALQALSVGQSDVQPFYYKVYINKKQYLTYESEIENSYLQFLGNFDFAFVVIYLFPLLIIVFSYNILSSEKEQGTWVLLKTSNQSIAKMMLTRIGIRYLIFTFFFWILVTPVLAGLIGTSFLLTANWYWIMAEVSLYFAFWFGLSMLVNSFGMGSNVNAMTLIFIWLTTGVIIPNVIQIGLDRIYPIPSRIVMLTMERDAINKYFEKDGQALTQDVFSSPKAMIRQASVVTPGMVYGYGVIVYKSQEIKDQATAVAEAKLYGQIEKQQEGIRRFQILSPALMMQEKLSALSGSHWHQFNAFSKDVDDFRVKTQKFYYPKMAYEHSFRTFSVDDAEAIPRFTAKGYFNFEWLKIQQTFIVYVMIVCIMILAGYLRLLYKN